MITSIGPSFKGSISVKQRNNNNNNTFETTFSTKGLIFQSRPHNSKGVDIFLPGDDMISLPCSYEKFKDVFIKADKENIHINLDLSK